jgi:23S rRNA-/tRNA-specific pseudouridylate synthase
MKSESSKIEVRMFKRIEKLYDINLITEYKFELAQLEVDLLEYYLLTGKKHQIEFNLLNLYARMWKLRR